MRIMHETISWKCSAFATLTYREANLPADLSLDRTEFTKFIKRLRRAIEPRKVRFYACGEYGLIGDRPHYHAILFGISLRDHSVVEDAWGHGFIRLGTVTLNSAKYVADYVGKSKFRDGRKPPFQAISMGIGRAFALDNAEALVQYPRLQIKGKEVGLPRYYVRLLSKERMELGQDGLYHPNLADFDRKVMLRQRRWQLAQERQAQLYQWHKERTDGSPYAVMASMAASARQRGVDTQARELAKKGNAR